MGRRSFKRLVVISDLHSGHKAGLTPPQWHLRAGGGEDKEPSHIARTERKMWNEYCAELTRLQPIDFLFVNGDAIEGKGERSGGTELITTDRDEQASMAGQCINQVRADKVFMTYGTPYHTGVGEDWENAVAEKVGAEKIGSHEWLDIHGVVFDFKHFIGGSSIPHGRATPMAKDWLWNALWAARKAQPQGDVFVRSHVHYFCPTGGTDWMGFITPALQAAGTKYGARRMSGTVDLGFMSFDVYPNGEWGWEVVALEGAMRRPKAIKLTE